MNDHERLQQIESQITTPPKQPDQPTRRPRRQPRSVPIPLPYMFLLIVWATLLSFAGGAGFFFLYVITAAIGLVLGLPTLPLFNIFIGATVSWVGLVFFLVWAWIWVFDSLTEYRVKIVAEGTARGNNE